MKKRITSILIALALLFGVVSAGSFSAHAESAMTASDECIRVLKLEEGFSKTPYWDFAQYTVGYGTRCPADMVEYYTQNGITKEEAETLLRNHLVGVERDINRKIIDKYGLKLTQNQFDALVMFSYNCGTAWAYDSSGAFHQAIANGATGNDLVRGFALWCSAGGQIRTYLLRRRLCEANMYLNGVYSQTPPENFCYVLYDANGGTTSPRSQGYDSYLTAAPFPVPVYGNYIFQGWYTAKSGGTKVTVLDASTKGMTLYAQWSDAEGNSPNGNGPTVDQPITITVTATDVNLRQGPGTNYTVVGSTDRGQQFVITETASGSGYTWGKFDGGWIALQFTDYETVINNQTQTPPDITDPTEPEPTEPEPTEPEPTEPEPTEPEPTEPEPTEPEPTEPEPTEPEPTEPEPTEPEPTEPEPTEPEPTEPEPTEPEPTEPEPTEPEPTEPEPTEPEPTEPENPVVIGTVNVQDWLRVRSGPGTSYAIVDFLGPQQKVEILEQITVGSQTWGKIANGWVSMDYIILDENSDEDSDNQTGGDTGNDDNTEKVWTGVITEDSLLRIRTGPGTSYAIIGYVSGGTKVTITEIITNSSSTWGKIKNGWISLEYVQLDKDQETDTPDPKPEVYTGIVNVQDWLRVRSGPGTSYPAIDLLGPKVKVTITEIKTVDGVKWGKISNGWISMDYVILDGEGTTTQPVIRTVTAYCLRVRSGIGTSHPIVGYLYNGTKVEIFETGVASNGGLWGRISSGWIYMGYTE